jgi:hypothetical protein
MLETIGGDLHTLIAKSQFPAMRAARIVRFVPLCGFALLPVVAPIGAASEASTQVHLLRTPDNGTQPQAAVDSKGVVHLIYFKGEPSAGDIFYVRRERGKNEFSKPLQVNSRPGTAMAMGTIRGAQLAVGKNGRVHIAWDGMGKGASAAPPPARNHDSSTHSHPAPGLSDGRLPLLYTRLNDAGTAFEPERNVITYAYGLDGGSSVAADPQGNVYVTWHAAQPGSVDGEGGRAVFVAASTDEGKTFQREAPAISKPTGACGCCGMRAFADSKGDVFALYRAAYEMTNRDEILLISRNRGTTFEIAYSHPWHVGTCPMSSASLSESSGQILAAAETHGRVFFVQLDPQSGKVSSPVSPDTQAKHPVAIGNSRREILLVWAEGTGWNKAGSVAWQLYDHEGEPLPVKGRADGLPVWSLPTAVAEPDGNFSIIY